MKILQDSREKTPWQFCPAAQVCALKTGDYTLEGYENVVCIERKKSVGEIWQNITQDRFYREIDRMAKIPFSYLIFEFGLRDIMNFPFSSDMPRYMWKKIKIKPQYVIKKLSQIHIEHDIHIIYADNSDYAQTVARSLMKEIYESYEAR